MSCNLYGRPLTEAGGEMMDRVRKSLGLGEGRGSEPSFVPYKGNKALFGLPGPVKMPTKKPFGGV